MALGADHNAVMIDRWRETVGEDDVVLHLGDLALGRRDEFAPIAAQLRGRKLLIRGNHGRRGHAFYEDLGFEVVEPTCP